MVKPMLYFVRDFLPQIIYISLLHLKLKTIKLLIFADKKKLSLDKLSYLIKEHSIWFNPAPVAGFFFLWKCIFNLLPSVRVVPAPVSSVIISSSVSAIVSCRMRIPIIRIWVSITVSITATRRYNRNNCYRYGYSYTNSDVRNEEPQTDSKTLSVCCCNLANYCQHCDGYYLFHSI